MTTTLQSHGGGAQSASIDTSGKVTGGTALRVYGFDTPEAARAAGYVCEGGPAMSVAIITDAQIASGAWKAEGDPSATVIYTAPSGAPIEGGYAVPIYPVNGWGSTPAPTDPIGDALRATALAYYKFDVDGADATGRGNNATNYLGEIVTGKVSNALRATSANNGFMAAHDSADLRLLNTRYFALWFKISEHLAAFIFSKDSVGGDVEYICSYSRFNDLIRFYFQASGVDISFVPDSAWHFLECYYKTAGNEAGIAIDNGSFTTTTIDIVVAHIVNDLQIGALQYTGDTDIDIDEFGIYSAIPDQDGRDYLFNSGAGRALFPAL